MNAFRLVSVCLFLMGAAMPALGGWQLQNSGTTRNLRAITASHGNDNRAWACGDGGIIVRTTDGGAHWVELQSGTDDDLFDIIALEAAQEPILVVGANGTILRSMNQGDTFTPATVGVQAHLRAISDFGLVAVGDGGTVVSSTDDGVTWIQRTTDTTARLHSVCAGFTRYIVGDSGTILRSTNQGSSWFTTPSGRSEDLYGTPMFGSADLAVGDLGLILKSTNFGASWVQVASGTTARLEEVEYSSNNTSRAYVGGAGGTVLKTTDSGRTWGSQASGTTADLHGLFFYLDDARGWAAGDGGVVLRTTDGGGPVTAADAVALSVEGGPEVVVWNQPNPFERSTTIEVRMAEPDDRRARLHDGSALHGEDGSALLEVFGPNGRRILTRKLEGGVGTHAIPVDLAEVPAGVYFARVSAGGRSAGGSADARGASGSRAVTTLVKVR